jgi:hypothetical protein
MSLAAAIAARLDIPAAPSSPRPGVQPGAVGHTCAICGRPLARARSRRHRACFNASPEKSRLAARAARANPMPGGNPRKSR